MRAESPAVRNPDAHLLSAPSATPRTLALIFLISLAAIAVHGYHPFVEDAEIYVPGIKKLLNPSLYPQNDGFFASHAHLTLFPNLIAWSVRISHLRLEWVLLLWHIACIFSLLLASWRLSALCFASTRAAWGSVLLLAPLLTIPVAGTALYIMDQYLNTRSFSTASVLWIVFEAARKKYLRAGAWLIATALLHPLMAGFSLIYAVLLIWRRRQSFPNAQALAFFLPATFFPPMSRAYHLALERHAYFFLLRWEWYEWLGIFGPLVILWLFARAANRNYPGWVKVVCDTTVLYGVVFFVAALIITVPPQMDRFVELQPLRSLHLVYIILIVISSGLLAEYLFRPPQGANLALKTSAFAALIALCAGMFYTQRQLFPSTPHLELPGRPASNAWLEAFLWIRNHTPIDAYFALDPDHMRLPGEDQHGFRAIAERSMLADRIKDSGAVTMFPALAQDWLQQVNAQEGWQHFGPDDFARLRSQFGVDWLLLQMPGTPTLDCPYQNSAVMVCRVPPVKTKSK